MWDSVRQHEATLFTWHELDSGSFRMHVWNHAGPPAGRWQLAFDLLRVMALQKERPNVRTFNAAIAACAEASEWQRALLLQQDQRWVRAYWKTSTVPSRRVAPWQLNWVQFFCIHQPCVVVWLFRSCPNISWNLLTWPTFPCWKQWTRQTNCTAHWRCSRTNSWAMKGGVWWDLKQFSLHLIESRSAQYSAPMECTFERIVGTFRTSWYVLTIMIQMPPFSFMF